MSEARATIRRHAFFSSWSEDELDALLSRCTRRVFNVGEPLWSVGEPGDAAFLLLSGRLERTRTVRPDGHRAEQYAELGALLSLSSLVAGFEHTSSGSPLDRVEALELKREDFRALFDEEHPAAYRLVDAIAENLVSEMRDTNRRVHKVFGQPAETLRVLRRRLRHDD